MLGGVVLIHHHIVGPFERAALNELKAAAHRVERREVHAGDVVEQVGSIGQHPSRHLDVRHLVDDGGNDLRQHLPAGNNQCGARRPNQDVGAHAFGAPRLVIEHAPAQSHQRQHHRHLNADGNDAE